MNLLLLTQHDDLSQSAEDFAAHCNSVARTGYGLVDKIKAMNYLGTTHIWDRLEKIRMNPAKYGPDFTARICTFMVTVQTYPETNFAHFVADTGALVMLHEITQAEADGFLALGKRDVTQFEEWGGEPGMVVTALDVNRARCWPALQLAHSLYRVLAAGLNNDVAPLIQKLEAGEDIPVPTLTELVAQWEAQPEVQEA